MNYDPETDELMEFQEFLEAAQFGAYNSYDGYGRYARMSSDGLELGPYFGLEDGLPPPLEEFPLVLWYNA